MTIFNSNSTAKTTAEAAVIDVRVGQATAAAEGCVGAEDTMALGGGF